MYKGWLVSLNPKDDELPRTDLKSAMQYAKRALQEPILRALLERSNLTEVQLETLLIDLVIEDQLGSHISYESKATLRSKTSSRSLGVSRGAFNRTLSQSRRNIVRCLYTMLLLSYLELFDYSIFRPFEELSTKIRGYRSIREVLSGRENLSAEDLESYKAAEQMVLDALHELTSPLNLKSDLARKRQHNPDE